MNKDFFFLQVKAEANRYNNTKHYLHTFKTDS